MPLSRNNCRLAPAAAARPLAAVAIALPLAGCLGEPLGAPTFSAVGEGLTVTRTAIPTAVPLSLAGNPNSIYGRRGRELPTGHGLTAGNDEHRRGRVGWKERRGISIGEDDDS